MRTVFNDVDHAANLTVSKDPTNDEFSMISQRYGETVWIIVSKDDALKIAATINEAYGIDATTVKTVYVGGFATYLTDLITKKWGHILDANRIDDIVTNAFEAIHSLNPTEDPIIFTNLFTALLVHFTDVGLL